MIPIASLWLPVLVSAAAVFIASSVIHMLSPWHKGDYPRLANEDAFRAVVGPMGIPPGDYMVPRPREHAEMRTPAFQEKMKQGPVMMLTVWPNGAPTAMGAQLGQWFGFVLAISALVALVDSHTMLVEATHHQVVHVTGLVAWMAYSAALLPMSIWYRRSWKLTLKATVDGFIYAGLTALAFGLLWPH